MVDKRHRPPSYDYIKSNKPYKIWWKVIAPIGAKLSILQEYDLVFDEYDLRIRKLEVKGV